jgi:TfoX/Sxy family transcriptional regulator of competence genes
MPYNSDLAQLLSKLMMGRSDLEPRKMFGGIVFMLNGNMCFGIWRDFLILRVGDATAAALCKKSFAKIMDMTGKPMRGWVMISKDGWSDEGELKKLIPKAIAFVRTLPAKN